MYVMEIQYIPYSSREADRLTTYAKMYLFYETSVLERNRKLESTNRSNDDADAIHTVLIASRSVFLS